MLMGAAVGEEGGVGNGLGCIRAIIFYMEVLQHEFFAPPFMGLLSEVCVSIANYT